MTATLTAQLTKTFSLVIKANVKGGKVTVTTNLKRAKSRRK